ncbi:uncharacterized protein PGTG_14815 [Puccinia graminis f. sp. tritici CRL 75-36-700-3]|uniref:Uncharacterized protein n=1 Tax=Puccinia graminis f. sp. tritici (strain CRL 75-36-700-3 / race SCCL) TaxID=418459 RepID=E3KWD5_PUCGT|nr:uncharacterized protein PGTG_14815 [Puccinia graminis f. sp. tritici CRL 75-36-700-3]EFP88610.1 hypothetical protein PGTG_14815 [Puccinia graminis f. sp. tritici CRL 75-36-700-3]
MVNSIGAVFSPVIDVENRRVRVRRKLAMIMKREGGAAMRTNEMITRRRIIDKRSPKGGGGGTPPKTGGSTPKQGGGTAAKVGGNNNPVKVQQKSTQNQATKQNAGVKKLQNTGPNKLQNTGVNNKLQNTGANKLQNTGANKLQKTDVNKLQNTGANKSPNTKTDTTALLAAGGGGTKAAGGGGGSRGTGQAAQAQAGGKRGAADLKLQVAEVSNGLASINGKKPNQIVKEVDRILSIEKAEDTARGAIKSAKPNDREVTSALATVQKNGPNLIKGLEKLKDVANDPKSTRKAIDDQLAEVNKLRKPLLGANTELIKEGQQV